MQESGKDYVNCLMGISIMCVVVGSSVAPFKNVSPFLDAVYVLLHLFHIPMLSFLAGVTGRFRPAETIFRTGLAYIVINFLLNLMENGTENLLHNILCPYGMMWVLPALFVWQFSIPLLDAAGRKKEDKPLVFPGMLIFLSLASGYLNISGTIVRIIVFYFFFVLGYLWKDELDRFVMGRRRAKNNRVMKFAGGVGVFLFLLMLILRPDFPSGMYEEFQAYSVGEYTVFHRLLFYIASNFFCILLIVWSARLHSSLLEKMGRNAYTIFLFYNFFLVVLSETGVTDRMIALNNRAAAVLYSIGIALFLVLLLSSDAVSAGRKLLSVFWHKLTVPKGRG